MEAKLPLRPGEALVTVWAKGFRVSEDSEEFQRVVPPKASELALLLEAELDRPKFWPPVLESLYALTEYDLAAQRCMLVRSDEIGMVSIGRSEDKHGRPSLVVVLATMRIDWRDPELGVLVSRASRLAGRLAEHFAATFRRNPADVLTQLRTSAFLSDRRFDLAEEVASPVIDWPAVVAAVRQWKGIQGVATLRLAGIGANVVLGTRHEVDRIGSKLDGFIDPKDFQIIPLSSLLTKWATLEPTPQPQEPAPPAPTPTREQLYSEERLKSIDNSLKEINASVTRIADAVVTLSAEFVRFWFNGGGRRNR